MSKAAGIEAPQPGAPQPPLHAANSVEPETGHDSAADAGGDANAVAETALAAPDAAPAPNTAGALLMRAREAAGLSRADVANKLKFSVKQIESVEADRYAALGGKTFVRGLIRTYAKLLAIDASPVMALLEQSELPPETGQVAADPKGVPFPAARPPDNPFVRYGVIVMVGSAVLIILLYFWHGDELLGSPAVSLSAGKSQLARPAPEPEPSSSNVALTPTVVDAQSPTSAARPPAAPPAVADKPAPPVADKLVAPVANPAPQKLSDKAAAPVAVAAGAASTGNAANAMNTSNASNGSTATNNTSSSPNPAAPRAAGRRILLAFDRDSWVEVKDASGRIVFSQLNLRGTQQVVEGRAPFELVIGNAKYVTLHYRDAAVDLKPYTKSEVAHVTLN